MPDQQAILCVRMIAIGALCTLGLGCRAKGGPVDSPPTRAEQQREAEPALALQSLVDLWHMSRSVDYADRVLGSQYGWRRNWERRTALGLWAEYRLKRSGGAVDAVVRTLEGMPLHEGDGPHDMGVALLDLLPRLGERGLKARVGFAFGEGVHDQRGFFLRRAGPALDADRDTWVAAFSTGEYMYPQTELMWLLAGDEDALEHLRRSIEQWITDVERDERDENMHMPDEIARQILVCAPAQSGVSDRTLRRWRQREPYAAQWASDLALARRGDPAAQESTRALVLSGFQLDDAGSRLWPDYRPHTAAVVLGELVEAAAIQDWWRLLAHMIECTDEEMLGVRAVAFELAAMHWSVIPAEAHDAIVDASRAVVRDCADEWLCAQAMGFLAGHPPTGRGAEGEQ